MTDKDNYLSNEINSMNGCGVDDTSSRFHEMGTSYGFRMHYESSMECPTDSVESLF